MPSSTSSSDSEPGAPGIPYRDIPARPWSRLVLVAVLVLIPGLVGWEALARSMHHTPGSYSGFGEQWAIERRKLDDPDRDFRVVLTGSSRMLWAADLDIMEELLGTRPLQLAIPGTSPRLIVQNVVEQTDFDGLIFVGYTPFLFNATDAGAYGQVSLDEYYDASPSKRISVALHMRLSDYIGFLDDAFDLFTLVGHYASPQLPARDGATILNALGWKLGNSYEDRQMDMWEPVETPGTFDWQQIIEFWQDGQGVIGLPPEPVRSAAAAQNSIEFFEPLVAEMRRRGGDIVFIRMPSSGEYRENELEADLETHHWRPHVEGLDALSINSWDYPELSTDLEIPEWSHLSRRSQDDWSRAVIPILMERYQAFRGVPLHDMLGIPAPVTRPE